MNKPNINSTNNVNKPESNKTPINKPYKENKVNCKIQDILFNNKDSFSLNDDSPAIDKWNNFGKVFKENYKMNHNTKENGIIQNNNINNIFISNNLNISKSFSQKEVEKHCINQNNLPKKCFYLSEAENEENKIVIMNNIENDNFGKVPITGYEITDHTGSGSSSDENYIKEDELLKKKKIPEWANDSMYIEELIIANKSKENERRIFGKLKISNLDLNLIFNTNKKTYKIRGDSADWKHDNTSSSKLFREDIEIDNREKESISKKLVLESKFNEIEYNTSALQKESQLYTNIIENN